MIPYGEYVKIVDDVKKRANPHVHVIDALITLFDRTGFRLRPIQTLRLVNKVLKDASV